MPTLKVRLRAMPPDLLGIYGPKKDQLGRRQLFLRPEAAEAYLQANESLGGHLVASDMFRSAESSLDAAASGRGAQPPGFSGHNFGLSVDLAVDSTRRPADAPVLGTLERAGISYPQLVSHMGRFHWFCFRRDGARGHEDWHFNFLGNQATNILSQLRPGGWARAAEAIIQYCYAGQFKQNALDVQTALARVRFYRGEIDGDIGPRTRQAVAAFGRAWNVPTNWQDEKFQRTLAFVAADFVVDDQELVG